MIVSGEICKIRFHIIPKEEKYSLKNFFEELRPQLEKEIKKEVTNLLGPGFDVYIFLSNGSITIWVIILTIYNVISNYEQFIKSIHLLFNNIRNLILKLFGYQSVEVEGKLIINPHLHEMVIDPPFLYNLLKFLLMHLIISHVILLIALILVLASYLT